MVIAHMIKDDLAKAVGPKLIIRWSLTLKEVL